MIKNVYFKEKSGAMVETDTNIVIL